MKSEEDCSYGYWLAWTWVNRWIRFRKAIGGSTIVIIWHQKRTVGTAKINWLIESNLIISILAAEGIDISADKNNPREFPISKTRGIHSSLSLISTPPPKKKNNNNKNKKQNRKKACDHKKTAALRGSRLRDLFPKCKLKKTLQLKIMALQRE